MNHDDQALGNRQLDALIHAMNERRSILQIDRDGRIMAINDVLLARLGYARDALLGRDHRLLFTGPKKAPAGEDARLARLLAGQGEAADIRCIAQNGEAIWLHADFWPLHEGDGQSHDQSHDEGHSDSQTKGEVARIVMIADDISAARRGEAERAALVAAMDASVAVAEYDLDGRITGANPVFLELTGYRLDEIRGEHHDLFCGPEDAEAQRDFWFALARGESRQGEYRRRGKGDRTIWLKAGYHPILDAEGAPAKIVQFATDISADRRARADYEGRAKAIDRSQAVAEFDIEGRLLSANGRFLRLMGYHQDEILGEPHRRFCDAAYADSEAYRDFWRQLAAGECMAGEFQRFDPQGREIWLQATYNPVLDVAGEVERIVHIAQDITQQKHRHAEYEGKLAAIDRAQGIAEFDLDGTVITANDNFCRTLGYRRDDILGQHHRMFCDANGGDDYRRFWERLAAGEYIAGQFMRLAQNGRAVWIQASYNPIFDSRGRPYKIVEFATDITAEQQRNADYEGKVAAIDRAQAVIEFDLRGKILTANRNFLQVMGYHADDIVGEHHRIFCSDEHVVSPEYRDFWQALERGEFFSGRFLRYGRFGRRIWIRGTYSPIFDAEGKAYKVVKFATDISDVVEREEYVENQARAMHESVGQLNESIASIAENTRLTREMARTTQKEAEQGATALSDSTEAMAAIQKSSEDIEEIVKVIGEIAAQTNLLAFNAAIEAARAGEHGLGFSVVADEVRKLAEKSADATRQINRLLGESHKRIESGNQVSREAYDAFGRIVDGVEQTTRSIEEIAATTESQLGTAGRVETLIEELTEAAVHSARKPKQNNAVAGLARAANESP